MLFLRDRKGLPMQVVEAIREHHPDFRYTQDYGSPGRQYWYFTVELSAQEYTLFLLRWGQYFAV